MEIIRLFPIVKTFFLNLRKRMDQSRAQSRIKDEDTDSNLLPSQGTQNPPGTQLSQVSREVFDCDADSASQSSSPERKRKGHKSHGPVSADAAKRLVIEAMHRECGAMKSKCSKKTWAMVTRSVSSRSKGARPSVGSKRARRRECGCARKK